MNGAQPTLLEHPERIRAPRNSDPLVKLRRKSRKAAMKREIARFDPRTQVIIARRFAGESGAQIAQDIGLSRQAVNKILREAVKVLRRRLAPFAGSGIHGLQ
jgi:DNA-directed RNA polymerase specialized sigma subunit